MLSPAARTLVLATTLLSLGGCEALELISAKIANRSETKPVTGDAGLQDDAAPRTATAAAPTADGAPQSRPLRVAVLDPADFDRERARHLRQLIAASAASLAPDEVGYYMDVHHAQLVQLLHPTGMDIRYEGDFIILSLPGGESFGHGSARLEPGAERSLNLASRALLEYSQTQITIHGHTDSSGEAAYNQRLSEWRALAVADHLLIAGIAPQRIAVVGFGESRPLTPNTTPADRARNRRIELHLVPILR